MIDNVLVSGGMAHRKNYTYGKFEFRVKATEDLSGATSAVVLTWPQSENWPDDGENDIYETYSISNPNRNFFETNILSGLPLNEWTKKVHNIDAKEWHVVAMEWMSEYMKIYIDGNLAWTLSDSTHIVDKPHHLCIQLDAFKTSMTGVSRMYVDWVKIYQPVEDPEYIRRDTLISDFENYRQNVVGTTSYTVSTNTTASVIDNPYPSGLNTSDKVLQITGNTNFAGNWEGIYSLCPQPDGTNSLPIKVSSDPEAGYRYMHLKMYRQEQANVLLVMKKLPTESNTEYYPQQVVTGQADRVNKWDIVTVDLLNRIEVDNHSIVDGEIYHRFSFQPKRSGGAFTLWIDDIYFSNSPSFEETPILTAVNDKAAEEKIISVSRLDNNIVRIRFSEEKTDVKIYNMQGQLLKTINNVGAGSFEMNLPANNIYIIQARNEQKTHTVKI
jgi:hypothetical protein